MALFAVGEIVLVPFPFSDLSSSKLRPAIVLASLGQKEYILCQVTSQAFSDPLAVTISKDSFMQGVLAKESYARPCKIFTCSENLIIRQIATLKDDVLDKIIKTIKTVLDKGSM